MDLPKKLREWRGTRRQVDVAEALKMSQPLLSMYEQGHAHPGPVRLVALLTHYEVPREEWGEALACTAGASGAESGR
jgi:transcriptional regulator with XRE-family HTH domain